MFLFIEEICVEMKGGVNCPFDGAHKSFVISVTGLICWLPGNSLRFRQISSLLILLCQFYSTFTSGFCFQALMNASTKTQTYSRV